VQLRDKVALVTGGARRVGRALAMALAKQGMTVAVHYGHSEREARETRDAIVALGARCETFQADLREADAPGSLIARVTKTLGGLDVLVNSAAGMERTPFGTITPQAYDEILALNLRAPFFLSQAAAPFLKKARGSIVSISDLAALETWPGYIPHGLSKSGILYITRTLATILAPDVRVNAIVPGAVLLPESGVSEDEKRLEETTPLKRIGSPDDVVHALLFLLQADYVTGEAIIVDGGRHVRR
jgi:pteridine reductase